MIGTNKSDAVETVTSLLADVHDGAVKAHGQVGKSGPAARATRHPRARHAGLAPH